MKVSKRKRKLAKKLRRQARLNSISVPSTPATASQYLHYLDTYHKQHPDMVAEIYCRVSAGMQGRKGNLNTHEKILRSKLKQRNIPVVGCHCEVSSGWILDHNRGALVQAVKEAKQRKAHTVIVTTSSDRYVRNRNFHTKERPEILPTEEDFKKLVELTCNVPLVTLLNPDMPPHKVRGIQSKWGQRAKGNKGGRPRKRKPGYKKKRRAQKLTTVMWLNKRGKTLSDIVDKTGVARSTVKDWIEKYGEG